MGGDVRPGAVFAGHRIERVIGRGGVSVVYLAEHLQLGRKVALKVLFPHLADDPAFRDRFIRESQIAAGLDHPNIVTVFDAGEVDGSLYLSMRYVEGSDLAEVVDAEEVIEPWRAVAIVSMIAGALDVAHDEGLVHRDVKPGNILLSHPDSPMERAYLSDFGITKRIAMTAQGLTRTGQFVGTVDYVAPEQIEGEVVDGRADVYSLGCVLYRCLAGQAPFPRPADVATIYAHLHDPPPVLPEEAPAGMDDVIARALAKSKDERYPTCAALAEAARSRLDAQASTRVLPRPVEERPPQGARRAGRRVLLTAAIVTAIVLSAVAAAFALSDRGTTAQGPSVSSSLSTSSSPPTPAGDVAWTKFDWQGGAPTTGQAVMSEATMTSSGQIIAAGHRDEADEDAAIWTRVRDNQWDLHALPGGTGPGDQRVNDIISAGTRVMAVGYSGGDGFAWYSNDDGKTWSAAVVPSQENTQSMLGVVQAPDGSFVAVGSERGTTGIDHGAVWTSPDGTQWARAPAEIFEQSGPRFAQAATTVGGTVVAVGRAVGPDGSLDAAVWEYRDGSWTQSDPDVFSMTDDQFLVSVTASGDSLVAVGVDDTVQRPVVWVRDGSGAWSKGHITGAGDAASLSTVVALGSTFIAAGWATERGDTDAAVWRSEDGSTWTHDTNPGRTGALRNPGWEAIRTIVIQRPQRVFAFGDWSETTQEEDQAQAQLWKGYVS